MAKILNSDYINGTIQRVVETPLGYIINGIYHDKKTMTPKPLQTFSTIGGVNCLGMNKNLIICNSYVHHYKTLGNTIINDRYDPTISYVFTTELRGDKTILKIRECNGKVDILKICFYTSTPSTNYYDTINSYVGQDKNYIYVLMDSEYKGENEYYKPSFQRINKKSLTYSIIDDYTYRAWMSPIKETNDYIYYGKSQDNGGRYIIRYNKIINKTENLSIPYRGSSNYYSVNYSNLLSVSDTNFYTFSIFQDNSSKKVKIVRYYFDLTKNDKSKICTEKIYNVGELENSITKPMVSISGVGGMDIHYESFITTIDNKSYLNIAVYQTHSTTSSNTPYYGIYTFEIDEKTKDITYKSFLNINDYFRGFMGVRNNTFLVGASDEKCYFMNFENGKFVITDVLANSPKYIGADLAENIWVVNGANEVEMYSPYVPVHVNIEYECENYNYEGENINTHVSVEAKNYSNENIASKLQFTITGNAVFSSNGGNVLIDTTLEKGKKDIPITITGDGFVTIDAEMIL